jgi:hypothetical protein
MLKKIKGFDMELMNELINSGVTLKGKQEQMVEDYIFAVSSYEYPKEYGATGVTYQGKRAK